MMRSDIHELFTEIGSLTEAVGRKIRSPKNDLDDFVVLHETLDHLKKSLSHATEAYRYSQP